MKTRFYITIKGDSPLGITQMNWNAPYTSLRYADVAAKLRARGWKMTVSSIDITEKP